MIPFSGMKRSSWKHTCHQAQQELEALKLTLHKEKVLLLEKWKILSGQVNLSIATCLISLCSREVCEALLFFFFFLNVIHFKYKILFFFPVSPAHQAWEHLLKKFFLPFIPSPVETNWRAINQVMCKMLMKPLLVALHCNVLQKLKIQNSLTLLPFLRGGILLWQGRVCKHSQTTGTGQSTGTESTTRICQTVSNHCHTNYVNCLEPYTVPSDQEKYTLCF